VGVSDASISGVYIDLVSGAAYVCTRVHAVSIRTQQYSVDVVILNAQVIVMGRAKSLKVRELRRYLDAGDTESVPVITTLFAAIQYDDKQ